jgi:hypothetical protein
MSLTFKEIKFNFVWSKPLFSFFLEGFFAGWTYHNLPQCFKSTNHPNFILLQSTWNSFVLVQSFCLQNLCQRMLNLIILKFVSLPQIFWVGLIVMLLYPALVLISDSLRLQLISIGCQFWGKRLDCANIKICFPGFHQANLDWFIHTSF